MLCPAGGSQRLPRMVGITLAKELIFTGGVNRNVDMLDVGWLSFRMGFVYPSHSLCLLSGKRVGGQTALEMGLVNRAVAQIQTGDAAYREALSLAREILPQVRTQTHTFSLCYSSGTYASLLLQARTCPLTSPSPHLCLLFASFSICLSPSLVLSSHPYPSPGLCRSIFLSLQFRCPQLARARVAVKWRNEPQTDIYRYMLVLVWTE